MRIMARPEPFDGLYMVSHYLAYQQITLKCPSQSFLETGDCSSLQIVCFSTVGLQHNL